ncbi:GntR family transcriptional regulator [candidate division KSB1 bacterium]|nr:GntR family transcriptional regulator [candidate division KSB1 bacterium]
MKKIKHPHLPLYYEISREIIAKIQNGELKPGMQIPSENEIIKTYHVSNTTARRILLEIESQGWAVRVKGKGTYVHRKKIERSATRILGFTRNMIEAGFTPSTKVLKSCVRQKGYSKMVAGRRYFIKGPVFEVHRLRFADHIPMMMEKRFISMQFCPDLDKNDLNGSLYDLYDKVYNIRLSEMIQDLSAVMMEPDILSCFSLEKSIPAILIEGVTMCGKEMILELEESYYRGDKYRFTVRAT